MPLPLTSLEVLNSHLASAYLPQKEIQMINLTSTTINEVSNRLTAHINWLDREEIAIQNRNFFKEIFKDSIEGNENEDFVQPLIEGLNSDYHLTVKGAEHPSGYNFDNKPEWQVLVNFGIFDCMFSWIMETDNGHQYCSEQTAVFDSYGNLTDEHSIEVECIFGALCDEICKKIMGGAIQDTPSVSSITYDDFLNAQRFFNTFGQPSSYYRVSSSIRIGEKEFETTYLVEASSKKEAELNLLKYLVTDERGIVEQDGEYYESDYNVCYEQFAVTHLTMCEFEGCKSDYQLVERQNVPKAKSDDIQLVCINADEPTLALLESEHPVGKPPTQNSFIIDLSNVAQQDDGTPNLDCTSFQIVQDTADSLSVEPMKIAGQCIMIGDVLSGQLAMQSYLVNIAVFDHLMDKANDECKFTFEDNHAVIFDLSKDPKLCSELELYMEKWNSQYIVVKNGGFSE